ncbi:MAG: hypothetical protein ACREA2_10880 [Blastocatellia bacterium]
MSKALNAPEHQPNAEAIGQCLRWNYRFGHSLFERSGDEIR